jgi:flagellar biosynthesis protein FlhF
MNLKRFTARTSRDALAMVKATFGDDAIVMSTKPCAEGVEVLAMAPESLHQLERLGSQATRVMQEQPPKPAPRSFFQRAVGAVAPAPIASAPTPTPTPAPALATRRAAAPAVRQEPAWMDSVDNDVDQLQMSTLSFQDYVRDRMLKRREAERLAEVAATPRQLHAAPVEAARARHVAHQHAQQQPPALPDVVLAQPAPPQAARDLPVLREEFHDSPGLASSAIDMPFKRSASTPTAPTVAARGEQIEMMSELRSMRGLIEQRFGALAFMEKLQRQPRQAQLSQRLLSAGLSPALIRKLVSSLPVDVEESTWAANVLERNLATGERDAPLEDVGGVYALIGATGVGKTTSTAKLAAAFATRHGAANLGLITLDAYRVGAHEQLRTYGRILGVPVHTAHDRASLEDLLELLAGKRMVLIDTAGMAQRDSRTGELLEMLSHRSINRVLVVNASAQGETIEDQLAAYGASSCKGLILSKLDEAVKLGPALDAVIRHKLKVLAVANGQRVPEDWHRLSAHALVQRALRGGGSPAWRHDESDMNLIFAGMPAMVAASAASAAHTRVAHA